MTQTATEMLERRESSYRRAAPKMSARTLLILLAAMCVLPPTTIAWLWSTLPPIKENQLMADVKIENAPTSDFYLKTLGDRKFDPLVSVVLKNIGDQPWTNINIRVNHLFNAYDHEQPILPGQERSYLVSRFLARGASYDMRYNPILDVLIYARLPDGSRATFVRKFQE